MEDQPKRSWGISQPISLAHPTEADLKLNEQLLEALKRENNFESPEGQANRKKVLEHLQKVTQEFVRRAAKAKGLAQSTIDSSGGKIFTFGSYALGAFNPASDIDTLLAAPKHIMVDDFFQHFPPTFREMSSPEDIAEFNPVPTAYVPIIKMKFRGVSIDLLFVSLPSKISIPPGAEFNLLDKQLLRGLDDQSMRSVNGTRVCKEILDSVPQHTPFRHALRAVKLWAERRGIYGNVFGYPGGVAWAIMVARICQLYPFACGATILTKFFKLLENWQWPRPVMLKAYEEGAFGLKVWNSEIYMGDKAHLMPVLTPAFPSMCSTHTITPSTKHMIVQEFRAADAIIGSIMYGKKSWTDLFTYHTFFTKDHKYYLSVIAACRTKEAQESFSGLVQSKVRGIVKGIDEGQAGVEIARPFPHEFRRVHRCKTEDQIDEICQGKMDWHVASKDVENGTDAEQEHFLVYTTTWYIGLTLPEGEHKSLDISYPVASFKGQVTTASTYDPETMSVRVVHARAHQLPDDVFRPGETRPVKPVKEKKKKAQTKSTKRSFAETGIDDSEHAPAKRRESVNAQGLSRPTPV